MILLKEFRDFAMRGNLLDISVAFVMGAAFGKVITSFTEGIISPLVGLLGGKDFKEAKLILQKSTVAIKDVAGNIITPAKPEIALLWGGFLTAVIDFIIVAFVMFLFIKAINSLKRKEAVLPAAPSISEKLLMEIRDALKR